MSENGKTYGGETLQEIVSNLQSFLNEKEKRVVSGRFGLSGKKETLSAIGRELKLSRERIRQIEKNSLRKMSQTYSSKHGALDTAIEHQFVSDGEVVVDEEMSEGLIQIANNHKFAKNYLRLICTISPKVTKIDENADLKNGWRLNGLAKDKIVNICDAIIKYLKEEDIPKSVESLKAEIQTLAKYSDEMILACIRISNKLMMAKNDLVGLKIWPSVNPRNVRDKIYFVLKTAGEPLHFTEITASISNYNFDNKRVVRATVHNELIADNRFVLIGRGIYALREWGYSDGTVSEVIRNILQNSEKPVSVTDIIELVNRSRKVKRNTIIINLQTKKEFCKVDGGYAYKGLAK